MRKFLFGFGKWDVENRKFNLALAATIFILMIAYAASFPFLIRNYGPSIRFISVFFIIPAALFWGIRGGITVGLLTIILNLVLHIVSGIKFEGGAIGPASGLVAIIVVGRLSDLSRQLKAKIRELRTVRDALQISETKYRKLFEMESDAVFLLETETGRILEANKAAQELFEYNREELLRMTHKELSAEPEKTMINFKTRMENVSKIYARKKNGASFPIEASARHFELLGHRVSIYAARDITFRKQAESEKRKLEKKLLQAQRMESIGTLAGGIAHDFNNILGAVIGYAELIQDEGSGLNRRQQSYLDQVLKAADRARQLVVQILTFSRQSESRKRAIRVTPIVEEAIELLHASIPTSIEIRQKYEAENDTIIADPTQIYQIVINLYTNSAQAMSGERGLIEVKLSNVILDEEFVTLHPEVEPGPYLELTIKDTGHGIDQKILERIFEPYFTTKETTKGTGLGLSVVHGIVMHHHGCILAESRVGKGTRFRVYFPLALVEGGIIQSQIEHMPTGTQCILVVDDESSLLEMTSEMLEMLGYRVEKRVNSLEALELFKAKPYAFDLVITDMSMPNMSGTELCNEINRINPNVPILICTGYSDLINEANAKAYGVKKILMKPVSSRDLAVAVKEALEGNREYILLGKRLL